MILLVVNNIFSLPYRSQILSLVVTISESASEAASSNQYTFEIDWFDVCFQLFITIVGFVFALWSARLIDEQKNKKDAIKLKRLLSEELKNVGCFLSSYNVELLEPNPLKTPMWESVINTGQLSLLDFETRETLFRVYNKIREFNSWALIYTNYFFEKEKKHEKILEELKEIKTELLNNEKKSNENTVSSISTVIDVLSNQAITSADSQT